MSTAFFFFKIILPRVFKFKKSSIKQIALSLYALLCLSYGAFANIAPITVDVFDDLNPSNSYSENDGSTNWTGSWTEVGDNNIPTSGTIDITLNRLYLRPSTLSASIYRAVDMTGITTATLTYNYLRDASTNVFRVQISSDLISWTTLKTYSSGGGSITPDNVSLDPYLPNAGLMYIRFLREAGSGVGGQSFDDINVLGSGFSSEPNCSNGIDDDGDGLIDCADSDCSGIALSSLSVSSCIDHPLADVATLTVDVAWTNPPSGEDLLVSISGKTEYVDVSGGATSPQSLTFLIPANGSSNDTLTAVWETSTALCTDTLYYSAPAACSTDTIGCNILYICGPEKPADGDAWDHGIIEYLDAVNGSATLTPAYTKADPTGMGLYDPMNISVQLFLNLADYDLIYISTTTENNVATGLIDSLKTTPSAVLNTNYQIVNDLGMSASEGFYSFRDYACIDNTNTRTMYNHNNHNSYYSPVILGGNPLANADAYLWYNPGDQAGGINSVYFTYEASDVLPGVASHGKRTFFGFHMNGVYSNPVNGGARPVPQTSWFDPIRHYTIDGKYYFDASLVDIAQGCSLVEICNNSLDDDGDGLVDCDDTDCCCAQAPVLSNN